MRAVRSKLTSIKGVISMAKVYADLIIKGLKTIDEVPEPLRAEVEGLLNGKNKAVGVI